MLFHMIWGYLFFQETTTSSKWKLSAKCNLLYSFLINWVLANTLVLYIRIWFLKKYHSSTALLSFYWTIVIKQTKMLLLSVEEKMLCLKANLIRAKALLPKANLLWVKALLPKAVLLDWSAPSLSNISATNIAIELKFSKSVLRDLEYILEKCVLLNRIFHYFYI